jgi:hypothetical protein
METVEVSGSGSTHFKSVIAALYVPNLGFDPLESLMSK